MLGSQHRKDLPVAVIAIGMTLIEVYVLKSESRYVVHQQVMGGITPAQ